MKTTFRTDLCAKADVLTSAYSKKSNESEEGGQEPIINTGALNGKFSVSPTKMVYFSKGNLQATINEKGVPTAWKFAANQYDFLGKGGANNTIGTQAGDVDLFGWSTASTNYGISTSRDDNDYSGDFVDWGKAIGDGKTWRTLSKDEWEYLFNTRATSTINGTVNARYAKAMVCEKEGIILLPDTYVHPTGVTTLSSINDKEAEFTDNNYNLTDWKKMEDAGAVFLPAAGGRYGSYVDDVGVYGHYWSSTADDSNYACSVHFACYDVYPGVSHRDYGYSVRLITESK